MATILRAISPDRSADAIRQAALWHWPRYRSVSVSYEEVPIDSLQSVIWVSSRRRLLDAAELFSRFEAHLILPYLPVALFQPWPETKVLFGPLIEENAEGLVVLDGMHRVLAAHRVGIKAIHAAILRAQNVPRSVGPLISVSDITIYPGMDDPPKSFEGLGYADYRPSSSFIDTAARIIVDQMKAGPPSTNHG